MLQGWCIPLSRTVRLLLAMLPLSVLALCSSPAQAAETLHVGSKRFTESYVLGEILTRTATAAGTQAEHLKGLGNTAIVFAALKARSIDLYPEYLGTIDQEILKHATPASLDAINAELAPLGLGVAVPLGFNNTYALAMKQADAQKRGIGKLSDLLKQPDLRFGLSHEFIGRADGWPGMAKRYGIVARPTGLDHGIAYEALGNAQVDVIDIYSTDAKIAQLGLTVLEDDLKYFPRYDAVLLYRLDVPTRFPAAWKAIGTLQGRISAADMIAMNAAVEIGGKSFATVANGFIARGGAAAAELTAAPGPTPAAARTAGPTAASTSALAAAPTSIPAAAPITAPPTLNPATEAVRASPPQITSPAGLREGFFEKLFDDSLWRLTRQHLTLVVLSVLAAALVGIPLGVLAAFVPRLEQGVMAVVGVLQTIPSLALLAMLIPLLGRIGTVPALIALFLYALLPIVRNTCTGMIQVPSGLRMAALALGLTRRDRLLYIDLPLAMPVILAGLKTAAVMSVGTATIAAFIGAGGYGERIAIGLALNDNSMLLAGAVPAAVLALITQAVFELIERRYRQPATKR